jgi:hypothetical protein
MYNLLLLLLITSLGRSATVVVPVHGTGLLEGVDLSWAKGASRVQSLGMELSAFSVDPAEEPKGELRFEGREGTNASTVGSLHWATLSTPRPVLRGSETLTVHGHRDTDSVNRQPGVGTRTVMVQLPEGAPNHGAVWLSGFIIQVGDSQPRGMALQALGVQTSEPICQNGIASFELTATLEAGPSSAGSDPPDYDATIQVDWVYVPSSEEGVGRLDLSAELQLGLLRDTTPEPPFTLDLGWRPPQGTPGVLAGLSGFSLVLADEAVLTPRSLRALTVDLQHESYDLASGQWRGELAFRFVNAGTVPKPLRAYAEGTVTALALQSADRATSGRWSVPAGAATARATWPVQGN